MEGVIPTLPPHLERLVERAARQELNDTNDLLTAVDINFYVLAWAAAWLTRGDYDQCLMRLQQVYDLNL